MLVVGGEVPPAVELTLALRDHATSTLGARRVNVTAAHVEVVLVGDGVARADQAELERAALGPGRVGYEGAVRHQVAEEQRVAERERVARALALGGAAARPAAEAVARDVRRARRRAPQHELDARPGRGVVVERHEAGDVAAVRRARRAGAGSRRPGARARGAARCARCAPAAGRPPRSPRPAPAGAPATGSRKASNQAGSRRSASADSPRAIACRSRSLAARA